jgi:hypothetical protein
MATATQEQPATIPNFREDERLQARYAAMLDRRIKTFFVEHESSVRRNASTKHDELREELDATQTEWVKRKEAADTAREAYRKAYPHHVKRTRLVEPTGLENLRSFGAAKKLYATAEETWRAAEQAASNIRRLEHNETQLDVELAKALERAPQVSKEVTESEKWLAEIHAEEEMAAAKAKVDEILSEREAYSERLAAGRVSADELRLRAFAAGDVKHIALPIAGIMFYRIEQFGDDAYLIVRDTRKQLYALPYDRRLEPVLGGVFDFVRNGKEYALRPSMRSDGRTPLSLLDHFLACNDKKDELAQADYGAHQAFLNERRLLATNERCDDIEATAIALLAELAAGKTAAGS